MDDFTSFKERQIFKLLGEMDEARHQPFGGIDDYRHGLDISRCDKENYDFDEMMTRFIKTFSGAFKPADGGDKLYEFYLSNDFKN